MVVVVVVGGGGEGRSQSESALSELLLFSCFFPFFGVVLWGLSRSEVGLLSDAVGDGLVSWRG